MQRILEPGEIAALDASVLPRIRLPEQRTIFAARASRLRALAEDNAISGYLRLMATVCEAQHAILNALPPADIDRASLQLALSHGMPVVPAVPSTLDAHWQNVLRTLTGRIREALGTPGIREVPGTREALAQAAPAVTALFSRLDAMAPADLDLQAMAVLNRDLDVIDVALAPFIYATLQIVWARRACALTIDDLPYLDTPGLCPACGSPPVASIVRIGGVHEGYRYLQCSLCATEFHFVRVKCAHCESTKGIAYHSLAAEEKTDEGSKIGGAATRSLGHADADLGNLGQVHANASNPGQASTARDNVESTGVAPRRGKPVQATSAESCDACHRYVKIFAQEKSPEAEPFADDLASLGLDLMMNEAGYRRAHPHPFLWPSTSDGADT